MFNQIWIASRRSSWHGDNKRDKLTQQCEVCDVRMLCNGGCPKDRFVESRDGEPGHNYLCEGLYHFYAHTRPTMTAMVELLRQGRAPAEVMAQVAAADAKRGRNDPCPCGSGAKFKKCHGARRGRVGPA